MNDLICHIAPLGMKKDWIKEGILYYGWNYLIILTSSQKEYIELAEELKNELSPSFNISDERELDLKLKKRIEIIMIENRNLLNFIQIIKKKTREIKKLGYLIYFNATSGLELWKFALYFIGAIEKLIDKYYYIPKDTSLDQPVKPMEIYLPIPLSEPIKKLLITLNQEKISQKALVEKTKSSKGLISRYLKSLREFGLIKISTEKKGKERYFTITEKGKWYL